MRFPRPWSPPRRCRVGDRRPLALVTTNRLALSLLATYRIPLSFVSATTGWNPFSPRRTESYRLTNRFHL